MGNAEQKTKETVTSVNSSKTSVHDIDDDDDVETGGDTLTVIPGLKRLNSAISTGKVGHEYNGFKHADLPTVYANLVNKTIDNGTSLENKVIDRMLTFPRKTMLS